MDICMNCLFSIWSNLDNLFLSPISKPSHICKRELHSLHFIALLVTLRVLNANVKEIRDAALLTWYVSNCCWISGLICDGAGSELHDSVPRQPNSSFIDPRLLLLLLLLSLPVALRSLFRVRGVGFHLLPRPVRRELCTSVERAEQWQRPEWEQQKWSILHRASGSRGAEEGVDCEHQQRGSRRHWLLDCQGLGGCWSLRHCYDRGRGVVRQNEEATFLSLWCNFLSSSLSSTPRAMVQSHFAAALSVVLFCFLSFSLPSVHSQHLQILALKPIHTS